MRVLVCGSRTFNDTDIVNCALTGMMRETYEPFTLIEGGAKGADRAASDWAVRMDPEGNEPLHFRYEADWNKHGGRAGPMRNSLMLREGKPDVVLAFVDKPLEESDGTLDMVTKARKAGVPTYVIRRYA